MTKGPDINSEILKGLMSEKPEEETQDEESSGDVQKAKRGTINLTVDPGLKKTFKKWCFNHDMTQVEAFKQAFDLLRSKFGD